ncbi:MAG: outer membrane protein assembly factor BamB [Casimicrobiaceae bacterium]
MAGYGRSLFGRAVAFGLAAWLAGCSSLPTWLGGTSAETLAPLPAIDGGATASTLWQVQLGGRHTSLLMPAVAGDRIIAAHPEGTIIVLDAASGAQRSRFSAGGERGALAGGVGANDDLIVVTTTQGWVLAFDEAGKRLWETRIPTEAAAPAAIADGVVTVAAVDGSASGLDAQTGKRKWFLQQQLPPLTLRSASIPIALRGGVFWGTPLGRLLALDAQTGAIGWEATVAAPRGASELERLIDVLGRPSVDEQRICAAAYQGRVACFDLIRGTLLWNREISSLVGTVMDARHVYTVDEKGFAYALDKSTGATVWRRDVLAGRRASGLALVGDRLAIHDLTGHLHFVGTGDGRIVARSLGEGFTASAPIAATAQAVVVQTQSGQLIAVGLR